jgi:hypothetical protein
MKPNTRYICKNDCFGFKKGHVYKTDENGSLTSPNYPDYSLMSGTFNFDYYFTEWYLTPATSEQHAEVQKTIEEQKKVYGEPGFFPSIKDEKNINPIKEMVNHPDHYKGNKFEVIDIIDDYKLSFSMGNAVKYLLRAGKKDNTIQDLKKAVWYIEHEIKTLENK